MASERLVIIDTDDDDVGRPTATSEETGYAIAVSRTGAAARPPDASRATAPVPALRACRAQTPMTDGSTAPVLAA